MDEQMKMAVSHDQGRSDPDMTPEEAAAIVKEYGNDLPKALLAKLRGPEIKTLISALPVTQDMVPAIPGSQMLGTIGASIGSAVGKYAPKGSSIANMAKQGIGFTLGEEGARKLWEMTGLPGSKYVGMAGGMLGAHGAGGGSSAAMSAEEGALGSNVDKIAPRKMPYVRPEGAPAGPFPVPNSSAPLTRESMPSNVDFHRTNADLAEQVQRGVTNDFKGRVTFEKPPAAPRVGGSPGEIEGGKSLDFLQKAMGTDKTKGNGTFKDTAPDKGAPWDKRNIPNPPGVDNKTSPAKYEEASKDYAELDPNYDAFDAAQTKIREALDRSRLTSTLKKGKKK